MPNLDRRTFLRNSTLAGGVLFGFQGLVARTTLAAPSLARAAKGAGGYGPLFPTPTENTGETLLSLPEGFKYNVFGRGPHDGGPGDMMSDGNPTPERPDGMAAFEVNGQIRLVRNHEVRGGLVTPLGDPAKAYDSTGGGPPRLSSTRRRANW